MATVSVKVLTFSYSSTLLSSRVRMQSTTLVHVIRPSVSPPSVRHTPVKLSFRNS